MMVKLKLGNELYIDSIKPDCEEKKQIIDCVSDREDVSVTMHYGEPDNRHSYTWNDVRIELEKI